MKKLLTCLIIMLLLGGIVQIAAQSSIKQDASVIGAIINAMSPGVMYADDPGTPPPPPTGPDVPPQPDNID